MTEPNSAATVPPALRTWVAEHSRADAIDNHGFELNLGLWNRQIGHLPGSPVTGDNGELDRGRISRGDLFQLAADARDDETGTAALRLFWHTLVWGTGTAHRNTPGRIHSVESNPNEAGLLLRDAARESAKDPRAAFLLLKPAANTIKSLGPNFFTKFLYFAGGGAPTHPCLIVDKRVLSTLRRETGNPVFAPKTTNYGVTVYQEALTLMSSWSMELTASGRATSADEVERWAFATG